MNIRIIFFLSLLVLIRVHSAFAQNTMTLDKIVNEALKNNLLLRSAQTKLEATQAKIGQAWGVVLPRISLQGTYSKSENFQTKLLTKGFESVFSNFGVSPATPALEVYFAKINVHQLLFSTSVIPVIQASGLAVEAAADDYESTRQHTKWTVVSAWFDALKTIEMEELALRARELVKAHSAQVDAVYKQHLATKADILHVKLKLEESEKNLRDAKKFSTLAIYQLNFLMGREVESPLELEHGNLDISGYKNRKILKDYLDEAFRSRKDFLAATKTKKLLDANVGIVGAAGWPQLFLVGSYGYGNDKFSYKTASKDWMIAVDGTWNIFDGFDTSAKVKEAQAEAQKMENTLQMMQQQVRMEVAEVVMSLRAAEVAMENAKISVDLASEQLRWITERFKTGSATNQDVLDTQFVDSQAQSQLIQSKYDYLRLSEKLKKVTGHV